MRTFLVSLLVLSLAACSSKRGAPIYEAQMTDRPWAVVQERQEDVARLSPEEQRMVTALVGRLHLKHDATGYPSPNQTFEAALRLTYGNAFDEAVRKSAQAAKEDAKTP